MSPSPDEESRLILPGHLKRKNRAERRRELRETRKTAPVRASAVVNRMSGEITDSVIEAIVAKITEVFESRLDALEKRVEALEGSDG